MNDYVSIKKFDTINRQRCGKCSHEWNGVCGVCNKCGSTVDIKSIDTLIKVPRVIAFVEGGVVHDVMANQPVQLRIIDYDTEGSGDVMNIKLPEGNKEGVYVHVGKWNLKGVEDLDPFFKQKAIR